MSWFCRKCCIGFASELIEQHFFANHARPSSDNRSIVLQQKNTVDCKNDKLQFYSCGNCAEGNFISLNTVTQHCLTQGHSVGRIRTGPDSPSQYEQKLLRFIEASVGIGEAGQGLLAISPGEGSRGSSTSSTSNSSDRDDQPSNQFQPVGIRIWSSPEESSSCSSSPEGSSLKNPQAQDDIIFDDNDNFDDPQSVLKFMECSSSTPADYSHIMEGSNVSESGFIHDENRPDDSREETNFSLDEYQRPERHEQNPTRITSQKQNLKKAKKESLPPCRTNEVAAEKGFEISAYVPPDLKLDIPKIKTNTTARLLAQAALAEFEEEGRRRRRKGGRPPINDNLTREQRNRLRHAEKCPYCPTVTYGRGRRIVHMRIHSGERPFTCNTCGKAFSRNETLTKHELSHTQIRAHHCDTCGKSFTLLETLVTHLRQHTGARPFQCPAGPSDCGAAFTCLTNLRYHLTRCKKGQEKQLLRRSKLTVLNDKK